jgi:hypothetical protein
MYSPQANSSKIRGRMMKVDPGMLEPANRSKCRYYFITGSCEYGKECR